MLKGKDHKGGKSVHEAEGKIRQRRGMRTEDLRIREGEGRGRRWLRREEENPNCAEEEQQVRGRDAGKENGDGEEGEDSKERGKGWS